MQDGTPKMRPGEDNCGAGRASTTSSPSTVMQVDDKDDDGDKNDSKRSKGQKGKTSSKIVVNDSTRKLVTSQSLEEAMKGLIISQIRGSFLRVEVGLLNLLVRCLEADDPHFTSAAISGHVDHFESVDGEDLGWGCGWRNIQILCSFLLTEDLEAREVLFNGAGFVPDIPALQKWLEIAWSKGFDEPGAEYFGWTISGTRKWIGTTECAALLRSFGVRAKIVSFTALGGKRTRNGFGGKAGSEIDPTQDQETESSEIHNEGTEKCHPETDSSNYRGGAVNCDECGKVFLYGSYYRGIVNTTFQLCDGCSQEVSQKGDKDGDLESQCRKEQEVPNYSDNLDSRHGNLSHWDSDCSGCGDPLRGRRYKCLTRINYDLCSYCITIGRKDGEFVIVEEFPASRSRGPSKQGESGKDEEIIPNKDGGVYQGAKIVEDKHRISQSELSIFKAEIQEEDVHGDKETRREPEEKIVADEDIDKEERQKITSPKQIAVREDLGGTVDGHQLHAKPLSKAEREKAGMLYYSSEGAENHINHHHLIEWVWRYFTEDSNRQIGAKSLKLRDRVTMTSRSPIYFQHRGHSQTIVGIHRQRNPTGISENVYFLVLDPSVRTESLVTSLSKKSGWQKLIKNDVHSLRESEYQLCYADPGVARGQELAQLKVLSSLRYSYDSN